MKFNCPGFMSDFDPGAMFLRILVPVDFGPESRRALGLACVFRQNFGSEIHVFHLTAFGVNDDYIRGLGQPWAEADLKEESKEQLRMFGESICRGLPCIYHDAIVGDDVVHGISEAVDRSKATLLILPVVHSRKRLLPSRSERIARAVKVPVLFLKGVTLTSALPEPMPETACEIK